MEERVHTERCPIEGDNISKAKCNTEVVTDYINKKNQTEYHRILPDLRIY